MHIHHVFCIFCIKSLSIYFQTFCLLSIFNISTSLEENVAANNSTGVQYDAARLVRLLLIFEPIEPVDGAAVDRTLVPDEEMSAQDPDLNYFLANDGIKERKKESF